MGGKRGNLLTHLKTNYGTEPSVKKGSAPKKRKKETRNGRQYFLGGFGHHKIRLRKPEVSGWKREKKQIFHNCDGH